MKLNEVVSLDSALAYLREIGATSEEVGYTTRTDDNGETYRTPKRITKLVKQRAKHGIDLDENILATRLANGFDNEKFGDLIPNDVTGPLSLQQKEYIRDNLAHLPPQEIAVYVRTNHQNVRLAQKGQFTNYRAPAQKRWMEPLPDAPPLIKDLPVNEKRPYGPLSIDEKIYIHDEHQDTKVGDLARVYNTSTTNIINAKKGLFKRPDNKPSGSMLLSRLLKYVDNDWRVVSKDVDISLAEFINKIIRGEEI